MKISRPSREFVSRSPAALGCSGDEKRRWPATALRPSHAMYAVKNIDTLQQHKLREGPLRRDGLSALGLGRHLCDGRGRLSLREAV